MLSFYGKSLLTLTFMSEWELADVWFDYEMCIRVPTKDKLCDKPLKTGLLKDVGMWYGRKLKVNKNGMCWNNEGLAMAISYDFSVLCSVNKLSGWDQVPLLWSIFVWVSISEITLGCAIVP
jgi:hypothetical protein